MRDFDNYVESYVYMGFHAGLNEIYYSKFEESWGTISKFCFIAFYFCDGYDELSILDSEGTDIPISTGPKLIGEREPNYDGF